MEPEPEFMEGNSRKQSVPMKMRFRCSNLLCLALLAYAFAVGALAAAPLGSIAGFHRDGGGYLGVDFENLTPQQRAKFQVPSKQGVAIAAVDHDAPAGKAGLRSNDVILEMDGKKAQHAEDLREALHKMSPGQTVVLNILRQGEPRKVTVVLADRKTIEKQAWSQHYTVPDPQAGSAARPGSPTTDPHPGAAPEQTPAAAPAQTGFLGAVPSEIGKTFSFNGGLMSYIPGTLPYTGILFDVMSPQLARYFGLKNSTGLLVKSVDPNSPGSRAGIAAGDVICKANDAPTVSRSRWSHILKDNRHDVIKLQILRNRQPQRLLLTLAASKS